MMNVGWVPTVPGFVPSGTVDAIDRAHLLNLYGGNAFDSPIAVVPTEPEQPTGGFFLDFDRELFRRRKEERERDELEETSKAIQDELEREIALEFRKKESETARIDELRRLNEIVREHQETIRENLNQRVIVAAERSLKQGNFSAMEALDRELKKVKEEELFIIQALAIIINQ